jgi:hypothetical protein
MAAMASSCHSASLPGETPSSRLRASRVSPRRMRRTTSVLRRLDHRPLSWRLADPAVGLRPPCGSASRMRCFFVMVGIVLTSPRRLSQETVHRPNRTPAAHRRILLGEVALIPTSTCLRN